MVNSLIWWNPTETWIQIRRTNLLLVVKGFSLLCLWSLPRWTLEQSGSSTSCRNSRNSLVTLQRWCLFFLHVFKTWGLFHTHSSFQFSVILEECRGCPRRPWMVVEVFIYICAFPSVWQTSHVDWAYVSFEDHVRMCRWVTAQWRLSYICGDSRSPS